MCEANSKRMKASSYSDISELQKGFPATLQCNFVCLAEYEVSADGAYHICISAYQSCQQLSWIPTCRRPHTHFWPQDTGLEAEGTCVELSASQSPCVAPVAAFVCMAVPMLLNACLGSGAVLSRSPSPLTSLLTSISALITQSRPIPWSTSLHPPLHPSPPLAARVETQ